MELVIHIARPATSVDVVNMDAAAPLQLRDDASDGDEPTQLDMTQIEPTQVASVENEVNQVDVEIVRCMICSLNLTTKSIIERELHLNACLDAESLETKYDCPTCGKQLTDYNEQRRMAHVNLCLDRVARFASESIPTTETIVDKTLESTDSTDALGDLYECRICGQRLSLDGTEARSRHVKQCGQRFGLRASDLAAVRETADAVREDPSSPTPATDNTTEDRPNAFAVLMASSISRTSEIRRSVATAASSAFDVLMKSARTESVASATATASTSARAFWHTSAPTSNNPKAPKRMRFTSSTPQPPRRYACPDFKRILGTQPPFIVDGFRSASKSLSNIYFLTHFHSDHYTGLTKSFDCGIIYCNHVTAALTIQELGVNAKFVHPVPMNTPVDIRGVQVTFMDANHCPGAAIILFRVRSGATYLHTGDFRFHPTMWTYAPLQPFLPSIDPSTSEMTPPTRRMDAVYLDTTYADPKYTFPTQETSIQHALTLVNKHISGHKVLFLFGSYSIGKERLFMEVAQRYDRKVCVSKAKLKMIKTYAWPDAQMKLLTTEPTATNLHVVPMHDLKLDQLLALQQKHRLRFHHIVAFRPTGWTFSRSSASLASCQSDPSGAVRIYGLPYSEHSSFAELCDFVRVLNPHKLIPTVNCHTERSVKKQIDALRQSAFHGIGTLFGSAAAAASPSDTE